MRENKRHAVQGFAVLLQNANWKGFFTGQLYEGAGKKGCVPGLNCYSCPAAVGACPLGTLQNALGGMKFRFPYYVLGLLLFFGALGGRIVCGFLCPFGFLQDLLGKTPIKKRKHFRGDGALRYLKYAVLVLTLTLPLFVKLTPFFCKYLCPSGTLAGILLAFRNTELFALMGKRFVWKLSLLSGVCIGSVLIIRPFCKYLCPLGAFYGLLNRVSLLRMEKEEEKCSSCGKCAAICPMGVNPAENPNSTECIRCRACISACPNAALRWRI